MAAIRSPEAFGRPCPRWWAGSCHWYPCFFSKVTNGHHPSAFRFGLSLVLILTFPMISLSFVKKSQAMRTLLVLFHLLLCSFPVLIFRTAIAKPIDLPWQSTDQLNAIAVRNPSPLHINALPVHSLSKRAPPTMLPGGAYCIFEEHYVSFSNIPAAAQSLQIFYHLALEALEQPRYAGLRTLVLCIQGGPFELYFRPHGNNPNLPVPLFMVKQFLALMLGRAERGWAMKYSGAVHEPDGAVFEMVLQLAGPVAISILDSAMDMYGS